MVVGGNSLIRSLECSQVASFLIGIRLNNISCPIDKDGIKAQLLSSLQESVTYVNLERENRSIRELNFDINCLK